MRPFIYLTLLLTLGLPVWAASSFQQALELHLRAGTPQKLDGETNTVRLRTISWSFSNIWQQVALYGNVLYEHEITEPPEFDEFQLAWRNRPWSLQTGRFYTFFGHFDTQMIHDPLPLYLGETRWEGFQASWLSDTSQISFFARPDWDGAGGRWGFSAGHTLQLNEMEIGLHAGYLSGMDLSGALPLGPAGWNAHVQISRQKWHLLGEWVQALEAVESAYPRAWQLEMRYDWYKNWGLALGWQGSQDDRLVGLPEKRWAASVRHNVSGALTLRAEAMLDRYADRDDTLFNVQLELHL